MTAAVCKDGCNAESSSMSSGASGDSTVARAAQTPEETPTVVVRESRPHPSEFTPGTILSDRYRIVSRLGKGGMGEVYRADDLRLGQAVALKFVVPRLAGQQQQLIDEVRVGREISHPNVCRIHDIGEIEGRLFISMEYIDGEDLASLLRRIGRLPHDKAVSIAREITAGLAAAHDRGIVHRDLKPANVMIDGRGNARITDFGLARSAAGDGPDTISGTPAYMAPEQFSDAAPTTASDIYALGLVFFELWAGRRLFTGTSIRIITAAIGALAPVLLIVRFGLLSVCAYAWLVLTLTRVPLTLDSSSWHFAPSLGALTVLTAVAAFAFHRSLGGKPMFAAPVFEE